MDARPVAAQAAQGLSLRFLASSCDKKLSPQPLTFVHPNTTFRPCFLLDSHPALERVGGSSGGKATRTTCSRLRAPFATVEQLDARLAELARGSGRARLVIGELLEALAKQGGHHELGFSSFEAYARERAGRSGRWAVESRTLARRLAELPVLRAALASGALGWCMAELVARHADPETEAALVAQALESTVREMRAHFAGPGDGQMSACSERRRSERTRSAPSR